MAAEDVTVKFGADVSGLNSGVKEAESALGGLNANAKQLGDAFNNVGTLTALQARSVTGLFAEMAKAAGLPVGPISTLASEVVRASQHFSEFATAGQAFEAIGGTIVEALLNPFTEAVAAIGTAIFTVYELWDAIAGPPHVSAEQALKDTSADIKEIGDNFKLAAEAAKAAAQQTVLAAQSLAVQGIAEARQALNDAMGSMIGGGGFFGIGGSPGIAFQLDQLVNELSKEGMSAAVATFRQFYTEMANGTLDVKAFRDALDQLVVNNPTNTTLVNLAAAAEKGTDQVNNLTKAIQALQAQEAVIAPSVGTPSSGQFAGWDEMNAKQKLAGTLNKDLTQQIKVDAAEQRAAIENVNKQLQQFYQTQNQVEQQWKGFFSTIIGGFDNAISGLINGTMTWKQAMFSVINDFWSRFVKLIEDMVAQWLAAELTKTAASQAAIAAQIAAEEAGESVKGGFMVAGIIRRIIADSAQTFAGIFANLSPVLGPAAAGPALAGQATVAAAASAVSFDVGSWQVPSDMYARVHQGEMIVPARGGIADEFREFLSGIGQGGGGNVIAQLASMLRPHLQANVAATRSMSRNLDRHFRNVRGVAAG